MILSYLCFILFLLLFLSCIISKYACCRWCTWPHFCNLQISDCWFCGVQLVLEMLHKWTYRPPQGVSSLWSQLHVTPSQLKLDWKAGPKWLEVEVTARVRKGQRRLRRTKGWKIKTKWKRDLMEGGKWKGYARCTVVQFEFIESLKTDSVLWTQWCLSLHHQWSLSLLG